MCDLVYNLNYIAKAGKLFSVLLVFGSSVLCQTAYSRGIRLQLSASGENLVHSSQAFMHKIMLIRCEPL